MQSMKLPEDRASIRESKGRLSGISPVDAYIVSQISDVSREQPAPTYPETRRQENPEDVSPGDQPGRHHPGEDQLGQEEGPSGGHPDGTLDSSDYKPIEGSPGIRPVEPKLSREERPQGSAKYRPQREYRFGGGLLRGASLLLAGEYRHKRRPVEIGYRPSDGSSATASIDRAGKQSYEETPREELIEETPRRELFEETPREELYEETPRRELFEETPREVLYEETTREHWYAVRPEEQWYTERPKEQWYTERSEEHRYPERPEEQWYTERPKEQWYTERPKEQWYTERPEEQWYTERPKEQWYTERLQEEWNMRRSEERSYPQWSSEWEHSSDGKYSGYYSNQHEVVGTGLAPLVKPQEREDERQTVTRPGEVFPKRKKAPPLRDPTGYGPGQCPPVRIPENPGDPGYCSEKEGREGFQEAHSKGQKYRPRGKVLRDLLRIGLNELRYHPRLRESKHSKRRKGRPYRPGEGPICGIKTATVFLEQQPREDSQSREADNRSNEEQLGSHISSQSVEPGYKSTLGERFKQPEEDRIAKKLYIRPKEVRFQTTMYLGPATTPLGLPTYRTKMRFSRYRPRRGPPTRISGARTRVTGFTVMDGLPGGPIGSRPSELRYRAKLDETIYRPSEAIIPEEDYGHGVHKDVPVAGPGRAGHQLEENAPDELLNVQLGELANRRRSDDPVGYPGEEPQDAQSDNIRQRSSPGELENHLRERPPNETQSARHGESNGSPKSDPRYRLREGAQIGTLGARPGEPIYRPKSDKPGYRSGEERPLGPYSVRPGELKYRPRSDAPGCRPREGPPNGEQTGRPGVSK